MASLKFHAEHLPDAGLTPGDMRHQLARPSNSRLDALRTPPADHRSMAERRPWAEKTVAADQKLEKAR